MRQGKLKLKSSVINETEAKSTPDIMCVGVKDGFSALDESHTVHRKTWKSSLITQTDPKPKKDSSQDASSSDEDTVLDDGSSDTKVLQHKKHKCTVCGARFQRPWRLTAHRRTHTDKKPFKCDSTGCLKSYAYSHHLERHKSRSHSDLVIVGRIPCSAPGCTLTFSSALNVRKHYKRFHDDAAYAFACPECDSKFRKHRLLRLHMIQHTGEAPLKCNVCGLGFSLLNQLNRHLRGHKEYQCDIPGCDRKFPNQSAFQKHKAEHNACFTTMECAHCNEKFKSRRALVAHVRTHLGEATVFKCTYGNCERVYYQKRNLTQHVRLRHEKISNFKCNREGCERVFATQRKLDIHINWHMNGPAKPESPMRPRKRRKDAGIHKRSFAAKLAGVTVPYSVEKHLLKNQSTIASVYSDEDKPDGDIKSECEQLEVNQELQDDQSESCADVKVQADLHQGLETLEGIVIFECVAEDSKETLQLSCTNISDVCASSSETILGSQQDSVGSSQTLGNRSSENGNAPLDKGHNQSCSESAENVAPSDTSVILTTTVPVISCLENVEYSEADLIIHITSPPETVSAQQAGKDASRESGSTVFDKGEDVPATPNHCTENSAQVLLMISGYENVEDKSIDSSSLLINQDTVVEFADDSLSQSSSLVNAADDILTAKAEDLSVAVVPSNNFVSCIGKTPCCQTKDNFSISKMNITESNTANVSSWHITKSTCEKLLASIKYDEHYPNLDKMKKTSTEQTIEDLAVRQLAKLVYCISSNMVLQKPSPSLKTASSRIIEKFSSDCVMDLPGPVRGHADDQEDSDSAEEGHGEAHDENSDSDRDDDFLHQDDHAEEEHAGGEGNGGDEDDGDDDDDDDENHDDDEVEGDGDEDDDENDSDDNHGPQEQNDGNDDNNNSNDSNCDSSSDGNRTIGGRTDSESSNDSHSFGDGSDMGIDRALPPVTDQDVKVPEEIVLQSSEDEDVDVENDVDSETSFQRSPRDLLEKEKQSIEFNSDPSSWKKSAQVERVESRKRIPSLTEVSDCVGEMVEAFKQADKPIIEASSKKTKSKPVTQSSNEPKQNKKQEVISPVTKIHTENSAMKEVSTQQDITARTALKRPCSDELPPANKFIKITESGRIRVTKLPAKGPERDEEKKQSQRKVCSELSEELWLNILRKTKDLWKLNKPLLPKSKIK